MSSANRTITLGRFAAERLVAVASVRMMMGRYFIVFSIQYSVFSIQYFRHGGPAEAGSIQRSPAKLRISEADESEDGYSVFGIRQSLVVSR